jgi:aspartate 1-decarboxylase
MQRMMLKSKIHRATVTEANLAYDGSLTIDADLMRLADILPYEMVHVYNINNGERFETLSFHFGVSHRRASRQGGGPDFRRHSGRHPGPG